MFNVSNRYALWNTPYHRTQCAFKNPKIHEVLVEHRKHSQNGQKCPRAEDGDWVITHQKLKFKKKVHGPLAGLKLNPGDKYNYARIYNAHFGLSWLFWLCFRAQGLYIHIYLYSDFTYNPGIKLDPNTSQNMYFLPELLYSLLLP